LGVILALLDNPDPNIEDNARKDDSDPFAVAINSVRGKAFQAFAYFVYQDGKKFPKDSEIKIDEDVKREYEYLISKENTFAIMFLCGYYLSSFYYRDKEWVRSLFSEIFSNLSGKKDLYLAAWEGYLSNNLYKELFDDLRSYYERAIALNPDNYTKRKYFKNLDEGMATHIALAFIHFPDFGMRSELFEMFWKSNNAKQQKEFISFIGRYVISRDNAGVFAKNNKINIGKVESFWDWALEFISNEEILSGFGFWMDNRQKIFSDSKWFADHVLKTLDKSKGRIEWEHGLMEMLPELAELQPKESLAILTIYLEGNYLVASAVEVSHGLIYVEEFFNILKLLYRKKDMRQDVYELINRLLPIGNGQFWKLKEILE
jgi:hypothetical protein